MSDVSQEPVSLGLAHEAEVMLRKVGATRENLWVPLSENEELARRVVELVTAPTYEVIVDYSRSLAEMIEAGSYDFVNDAVTAEHLPIKGEGTHKTEVVLLYFNKAMRSDNVIAEMEKQGYRSARIEELLALGELHPNLQKQFPIVALGSPWQEPYEEPHDRRLVPYLCWHDSRRRLSLSWFRSDWYESCRFLAVRNAS